VAGSFVPRGNVPAEKDLIPELGPRFIVMFRRRRQAGEQPPACAAAPTNVREIDVRTEAGSCPPYSPQIRAVAAAVPSRWGRPRREQIAQDLRDNTIQRIFAVSLGMTALAGRLDDPQVQRRLEEYVDDLDIAISAIYAAVSELTSNESDDEISEMS
jgi:hypothetical protein